MKRIICQFLLMLFAVLHVSAQTPLEVFSTKANALLQAEFGFGITNIPVYSMTDPAVGYDAAIHFQLQSAADLYDTGTLATNLPSVFRPLFSWQSNTLFIVGYSCVTTDFDTQIGQGFKNITDPTITTNDNVWGIPWVVGTKGQIPAFNEYCYSSEINVQRQLAFVRFPSITPGQYLANRPPEYTNQFYIFSISNIFGAEAWNFYSTDFTNEVSIIISNHISITFTNNYNFGTNAVFDIGTNIVVENWTAHGFIIPEFTNTLVLPESYWSEAAKQLINLTNGPFNPSSNDLHQTGWPVHDWIVTITNNFMYALVDNNTGRALDFVNLGPFGSSLDLNNALSNSYSYPYLNNFWASAPATDAPNSLMSEGVISQIGYSASLNLQFLYSLLGRPFPYGYPSTIGIFYAPVAISEPGGQVPIAGATFIQSCSWHTGCPMVHYTLEDLTDPRFNQEIQSEPLAATLTGLMDSMSGPVCTLGKVNPDYTSGEIKGLLPNLGNGLFQLNFCGAPNSPYLIWASTNLIDWTPAGTASQPGCGSFQFRDPRSFGPMKFYDVQLP